MNKKIFFIISSVCLILPTIVFGQTLTTLITHIENVALDIAVPIVIIGWIIAGIMYLTAAGGPRMEVAKKALIACTIGTVLIAVARAANAIINIVNNALGL